MNWWRSKEGYHTSFGFKLGRSSEGMWCQAEAEGLELRTRFLLRVSVDFVQVHSIFNAELGILNFMRSSFLN